MSKGDLILLVIVILIINIVIDLWLGIIPFSWLF